MAKAPHTQTQPDPDHPGLRLVAWHQGGAVTLRTGKRHRATEAAVTGTAVRETLCGRSWRVSREVTPDTYWTTGDCQACLRRATAAVNEVVPGG